MLEGLNRWLDGVARARIGDQSAFLVMGAAGFYGALAVTVAGGLITHRSLSVLALLTAVSVGSFFAYIHLGRLVSGHEQMVQQHQVWLALLSSAGALVLLRQPVRPFLDVLSAGLATFLAGGRLGCLMVGCCFGRPSTLGIRYGQDHAGEGFPTYLVGVRLFPVQGLELLGLSFIALTSFSALPFAVPGAVLCWFLFSHALLRFAVDPFRWDSRTELLGLSQARWRSVVQIGVAIALADGRIGNREAIAVAIVLVALAWVLVRRTSRDPRRCVLSDRHLEEMRALASVVCVEALTASRRAAPSARRSSAGVTIVATGQPQADRTPLHVSLAAPRAQPDLRLLCDLASLVFPDLRPEDACASTRGVLHLLLEAAGTLKGADGDRAGLADRLYLGRPASGA